MTPDSADDRRYRAQVAYLLARSPFYRAKLAAAGFADAGAVGGLDAHRPPAVHREGRAARGPSTADGADRRASRGADGRGGARLLDQRHHRQPLLHPADPRRPRRLDHHLVALLRRLGRRGRRADRHDLQRRAVRRRGGARGVPRARARPGPGRLGPQRAAARGGHPAGARRRGADALLRPAPRRARRGARHRPRRLVGAAAAGRRRARRRRAGAPGAARGGMGRARHRGDGHRRHRRLALGRVRTPDGHALLRAGAGARRADRPGDRRGAAVRGRGRGRARLHPPRARGGAAAALPQPRPRPGVGGPLPLRPRGPAGALHRPDRRHADRARRQRLPERAAGGGRRARARGNRGDRGAAGGARGQAEPAAAGRGRDDGRGAQPTSPSGCSGGCASGWR